MNFIHFCKDIEIVKYLFELAVKLKKNLNNLIENKITWKINRKKLSFQFFEIKYKKFRIFYYRFYRSNY